MRVKAIGRSSLMLAVFIAGVALAETVLSKEFLEYLAEFETESGEWVDPEELELLSTLDEDSDNQQQVDEDD